MHDPVISSEMREINLQEMLCDDGIPDDVDEDRHLHDYDYDEMQARIHEHYLQEYLELRGIGLVE